MKEPKHISTPTSVTDKSNKTPITQQDIPKVEATEWKDDSLTQLYEQLTTLENRRMVVAQMGKFDMVRQIEAGIAHLRTVIQAKQKESESIL